MLVRHSGHKHADAPNAPRLLRLRGERPRNGCAAEPKNELPSSDTDCHSPVPEGITLRIEYHALKWRSVALKIKVDMRGGFREYSATNAVRRCGRTITVCLVAATIQTGLDIVDPHKEQNLN